MHRPTIYVDVCVQMQKHVQSLFPTKVSIAMHKHTYTHPQAARLQRVKKRSLSQYGNTTEFEIY